VGLGEESVDGGLEVADGAEDAAFQAAPGMTLFLLSGMMFVYALSKASLRLLQGPQETTIAVPSGRIGPALSAR
jgi:hypothetical protein